jgi:phosphoesterase RecJ-like protein
VKPAAPHYPAFAPRFAALLAALPAGRLVVIGHARPDGDCIGAQVALARVLRALGREVVCANPDPVPRRLQFCVGDTPFVLGTSLGDGDWTALFVDCADLARAGDRLSGRFPAPFACFDHHLSNPGFAAHNLVDPDSAATCEILAGLFSDQGLTVDPTTATGLYAGIATDTGQFRFHSTTRRTFLLAAELVAAGANPAEAAAELYERESRGKLKLLERFLASFHFECRGRVCIGVLPAGSYEGTGTQPEDIEGMVDYARGIDGVDIGVLIEERAGGIKASLRAKDPACRVDRVAAIFGGGGHACAAGLNLKGGTPADFRAQLLAALTTALAALDAARTKAP